MDRARVVAAVHELISRRLFDEAGAPLDADLCASRGWTIIAASYPTLEVQFDAAGRTAMRVRLLCDQWNELPPSIVLLDGTGQLLGSPPATPRGQFNPSAHPTTGRPFVCMVGSREYHTHPSHTGDRWANYRDHPSYTLGGIVTQLWRAWQEVPR